jgi:hypothetical protein
VHTVLGFAVTDEQGDATRVFDGEPARINEPLTGTVARPDLDDCCRLTPTGAPADRESVPSVLGNDKRCFCVGLDQ